MSRKLIALLALSLLALSLAPVVSAGPPAPPNYGVMEPVSDACPWPDFLNPVLEAEGVQKCLPTEINWTSGDGIRIVTDPLVGSGDDAGSVTFWCESKVGFKYQIVVWNLAPNTSYPVTATDGVTIYSLGTIRTDSNGSGVLGGMYQLSPGFYEWDINVGSVLSSPASDEAGFVVFP
ncbi:MAG: hypothetical protein HY664_07720 [Chloroflexi bacterium]|nr:hypothetical protein [Chloroflexota bacterium]